MADDLIIGLDIGTTKVCAVVGEECPDGNIKITGIGECESKGLRQGMVVNIDDTVKSIRRAVEAAGQMAGYTITEVYVGVAGSHIEGHNSHGVIAIQDGEVSEFDKDRVIQAACAVPTAADKHQLHKLPQEFIVDDQRGIMNPVGMVGVRLEVSVHIVTAALSSVKNIVNSCRRAGLDVLSVALESFVSAKAVLTDEERELGVVLIDVGGGTSDVVVYENNAVIHTAVFPFGGVRVTSDIAFGLRTPTASAEKLKIKYGCAYPQLVDPMETIEVPTVGGRGPQCFYRSVLADICAPRMAEIFQIINENLVEHNCKMRVPAGIVLTGGASLIEGCKEIAEEIFNLPVRIAIPRGVCGLTDVVNNPKFSTAVGLLMYAVEERARKRRLNPEEPEDSLPIRAEETVEEKPEETPAVPDNSKEKAEVPEKKKERRSLLSIMRSWFKDVR